MIGVNWTEQELQKELDWVRSETKTAPHMSLDGNKCKGLHEDVIINKSYYRK